MSKATGDTRVWTTGLDVRNAATWPTLVVYVALTIVGSLAAGGVASGSAVLRVLVPVLSAVIAWLFVLAFRGVAARFGGVWRSSWVLIVVLVLGGVLRGYVLDVMLLALGWASESRFGYRAISGVLVTVLVFTVMAHIVGDSREHARRMADMRRLANDLEQARDRIQASISGSNAEAMERIKSLLTSEVSLLDAQLPRASLATLQRTASDIVRPLSHELASQVPNWTPRRAEGHDIERVNVRAVLAGEANSRPFMPAATALSIGIFAVPMSFTGVAAPNWIALPVCIAVLTWLLLTGLNAAMSVLAPRGPGAKIVAAIGGLILCGVAVVAVLLPVFTALGGMTGRNLAVATAFFLPTVGAGFAAFGSARAERRAVEQRFHVASEELRWQLARVGQVQWYQQQALSRALHGPIQSAVTAAAIRLDCAIRDGSDTAELVVDIQRNLSQVVEGLDSTSAQDADVLGSTFHRLEATWAEIAEIDIDCDSEASTLMADDPVAAMCISELIGESTSNAIRHGGARRVHIVLTCDARTATLTIEDDGTMSTSPGSGIGSRLVGEMAIFSEHEQTPDGHTRLCVVVPLGRREEALVAAV